MLENDRVISFQSLLPIVGAKVDTQDRDGHTPLFVAAILDFPDIVSALLKAGKKSYENLICCPSCCL